jgi:hypothetical protein
LIFLAHHGIKGQTWGVRNGPPYPLSASQHSAKERKADWRSSLASNNAKKASGSIDISKDAKFRLTEKQKRAIKIGAAIAATALLSYGGYKLYKSGALNQYIDTGDKKVIDILNNKETDVLHETTRERLSRCNPHFTRVPYTTPYNRNCGNAVIAYELRCRGQDVQARGNNIGMTFSNFGQFFSGISSDSVSQLNIDAPQLSDEAYKALVGASPMSKQITRELSDRGAHVKRQLASQLSDAYPPGSRGSLILSASFGSHWISWEKTENGVTFLNPQDPALDLDQFFSTYTHRPNKTSVDCALRLDNLSINTDNIKDAVIDRLSEALDQDMYKPIEKGDNFVLSSRR